MSDPMLRRPTKQHKSWMNGVRASTYGGRPMPLEEFGVTFKRIRILEDMGMVEFKEGLYILTEKGNEILDRKKK